jgi:hypothetical protein
MSRHEGDIRLRRMLDHAREAVAMASGRTRRELDTDRQLNLSLVRLLEALRANRAFIARTTETTKAAEGSSSMKLVIISKPKNAREFILRIPLNPPPTARDKENSKNGLQRSPTRPKLSTESNAQNALPW